MKIFYSLLLFFISSAIFATVGKVGPEVWITGQSINNSSFSWGRDLKFVSYNQEAEVDEENGEFKVRMIAGNSAIITLAYQNEATRMNESLCQFRFSVDTHLQTVIQQIDMPPSYVNCQVNGNPNNNTAEIIISDNATKKRIQ